MEKAKTLRNLIPDEAELVRIINLCRIFNRRVIKEQKIFFLKSDPHSQTIISGNTYTVRAHSMPILLYMYPVVSYCTGKLYEYSSLQWLLQCSGAAWKRAFWSQSFGSAPSPIFCVQKQLWLKKLFQYINSFKKIIQYMKENWLYYCKMYMKTCECKYEINIFNFKLISKV